MCVTELISQEWKQTSGSAHNNCSHRSQWVETDSGVVFNNTDGAFSFKSGDCKHLNVVLLSSLPVLAAELLTVSRKRDRTDWRCSSGVCEPTNQRRLGIREGALTLGQLLHIVDCPYSPSPPVPCTHIALAATCNLLYVCHYVVVQPHHNGGRRREHDLTDFFMAYFVSFLSQAAFSLSWIPWLCKTSAWFDSMSMLHTRVCARPGATVPCRSTAEREYSVAQLSQMRKRFEG